jgi:hypothetical protein
VPCWPGYENNPRPAIFGTDEIMKGKAGQQKKCSPKKNIHFMKGDEIYITNLLQRYVHAYTSTKASCVSLFSLSLLLSSPTQKKDRLNAKTANDFHNQLKDFFRYVCDAGFSICIRFATGAVLETKIVLRRPAETKFCLFGGSGGRRGVQSGGFHRHNATEKSPCFAVADNTAKREGRRNITGTRMTQRKKRSTEK